MGLSKIEDNSLTLTANSAEIKKALNADNGAPIYACRAWVNFNGTGTVAIRASGNVSSITDNGTGYYTVNFTTAMPDTNYCVASGSGANADPAGGAGWNMTVRGSATTLVESVGVLSGVQNSLYDIYFCYIAIFR